jgi:hypothetical protein
MRALARMDRRRDCPCMRVTEPCESRSTAVGACCTVLVAENGAVWDCAYMEMEKHATTWMACSVMSISCADGNATVTAIRCSVARTQSRSPAPPLLRASTPCRRVQAQACIGSSGWRGWASDLRSRRMLVPSRKRRYTEAWGSVPEWAGACVPCHSERSVPGSE